MLTEILLFKKAIATGWGLLEFAGRENSAELQKVTLNVLTSQECNVYFRGIRDEKIDRGIVDEQIVSSSRILKLLNLIFQLTIFFDFCSVPAQYRTTNLWAGKTHAMEIAVSEITLKLEIRHKSV